MVDVLLVTSRDWPLGEPGAPALDQALVERKVSAQWVVWDDGAVDWGAAQVVAVRSTWDYVERREEFLAWAERVSPLALLLNGPQVFAWNTDKQYLVELGAAGVPVVPTVAVDEYDDLVAAAASLDGRVVVKPRVGAGGLGLVVVDDPDALADAEVGRGPWAVQPVVESVSTEGELSVFLVGGEPTLQVQKLPAHGEIRVHEHHGGRSVVVPLTEEAVELARTCVSVTQGLLGTTLHYARVDQMLLPGGELAVSELEATEPGLYLDVAPQHAGAFASYLAALTRTSLT